MGLEPKDFDLVTNATPEQISKMFPKTVDVGVVFGVSVVVQEGEGFEIATFRKDLDYTDGRHPTDIEFAKSAQEDVLRRDFTINALYWDFKSEKTLDFVQGKKDIARRLLKTVGDPKQRFAEDQLRVLRALRFSACYELEVHRATNNALYNYDLKQVSSERILQEVKKAFGFKTASLFICVMDCTGHIDLFLSWHKNIEATWKTQIKYLILKLGILQQNSKFTSIEFILMKLSALFLGQFKNFEDFLLESDLAVKTKSTIKFSKKERSYILDILLALQFGLKKQRLGQVLQSFEHNYEAKKEFSHFFVNSQKGFHENSENYTENIKDVVYHYERIAQDFLLPEPYITGKELLKSGVEKGPQLGALQKNMYYLQLEGHFANHKEAVEYLGSYVK